MCFGGQPSTPAPTAVVQRQAYKAPSRASRSTGGEPSPNRGSGSIGANMGLLDAAPTGRAMAGGDQKLMPDLGAQSVPGGSILTESASGGGGGARMSQPNGGGSSKNVRGQRPFSPNISRPWLAAMQAR